jgi:hypothetical protein
MSLFRILATVGLSLGAAITAGLYFAPEQPEATLRPASATASLGSVPSLIPAGSAATRAAAEVTGSIATFVPDPDPARRDGAAAAHAAPAAAPALAEAPPSQSATDLRATDARPDDCTPRAQLSAQPAAMLSLTLDAPCDAGEPVAISHGALLLAAPVGEDGRLSLALPALRAEAGVTLAMLDGRVLQLGATVPDFALYQRVVLGWDGPAALDLHAFVGGAGWNEPGHVRAGGPVSAATGFVTVFGDAELGGPQARVYTYPVGIAATAGHVALEAVLAVTDATCGQPFEADVHAILGATGTQQRNLRVEMPGCTGSGGFVAIPDLLPGLARGDVARLD